jgi:predicted RNase H-like nuclease
MRLLGVDGCKAGWVVASSDESLRAIHFAIEPSFEALIASVHGDQALIVIDVPIGLTEREPRRCDLAARALVRAPRSSSVFPAPRRPLLGATTYAEACRLSREACNRAVSQQLFGILPKIREVDLLMTPARQDWVREAHPEVTFAVLSGRGRGLLHYKKSREGEAERLAILGRLLPAFDPSAVRAQLGRSRVAADDVVDAVACLATADRVRQGEQFVLPQGEVPRDERGLRMEIIA